MPHPIRPARRLPVVVLLAALTLAACGDDGDEGAGTTGDAAATTDGAADGVADVEVASTSLGDVLVDGAGMTLYLFTPDTDGESTCYDDCAAAWPPATVDGTPVAGDGIDGALLATTERTDGTTQVTYDGQPLYLWRGDQEPGDVTGQNVEEVWFVVAPSGEAITTTPDTSRADDGY